MKPTSKFSHVAIMGYSLYFLIEAIIYPLITKVPPLLSAILNVLYIASFIAVAAWIISLDNTLKKPAIFIIIATVFAIVNRVITFTFYMQGHSEMNMVKYSLLSTTFYLPHLIFTCIGFFKLAKGLPKGYLARYMAKLIPWAGLAPLVIHLIFTIIMEFTTIPNAVLRCPSTISFLTEIIAIMLLCYSLPKAIEIKRTLVTEN